MSDMKASVSETSQGFRVQGVEVIDYDFTIRPGVFNIENPDLAECYKPWGRALAVTDSNVYQLYGEKMEKYFQHYDIKLKVHQTKIGEKAKSIPTFLSIVDSMNEFGIIRKEPVLVVGGGLVTDVAGFACAAYRRNTNYIRVGTTLVSLIDSSVSIKVACNYGRYKNRLGAYHAPKHTFLDFDFLKTLPIAQVRNGFAEIIKISSCAQLSTFDLLDKHCEKLINSGFGRREGSEQEVRAAADTLCRDAIYKMLQLESPNLHEIGLDRIIAYGHTWSPLHELIPDTPLRHGHAISIDMAYSATLAHMRGLLSDSEYHRLLNLFSRAGLSMDHPQFDAEVLDKGTAAILKTRDGLLRAAVPSPLGSCVFLNDVSQEEMNAALQKHKEIVKSFPRNGEGIDAYVDADDLGDAPTTANGETNGKADPNGHVAAATAIHKAAKEAGSLNQVNGSADDHLKPQSNGVAKPNGYQNRDNLNGADEGLTAGGDPNGVTTNGARA